MNDEQFSKIKLNRTLYSAKRIGSGEPEYFLDYKITTVRYLPTDEHYDIVREMFEICENDPDNVVNWYNEKLLKNVKNRLEEWDKDHISINMMKYERLIKCKNETRDFLMDRGRVIPQNILTEKQPEKESDRGSGKTGNGVEEKHPNYKDLGVVAQAIVEILATVKKIKHNKLNEKLETNYPDLDVEYIQSLSQAFRDEAKLFYKDEIGHDGGYWYLKRPDIYAKE